MRLTIVLTVYNKGPFLQRALNSLLLQEGILEGEYEVLAVNDGSTDTSASILEEYACQFHNLRILSQDNQGLSMARNNGIDNAYGDYIWFVDADDVISSNAVSLIYEATMSSCDVIPFYAKTEGLNKVRNNVDKNALSGKALLLGGNWEHCAVFYVYKHSFLIDNALRFRPGIYHEDAEFTPRMLYAAKSVKVIPTVLYTVIHTPESITQIPNPKRAFDYLTVAKSLSFFVIEHAEESSSLGHVIDNCAAVCLNNAMHIISQNSKIVQTRFGTSLYNNRSLLFRSLNNSTFFKYKVEARLFELFPKRCVSIYKLLKHLSGTV